MAVTRINYPTNVIGGALVAEAWADLISAKAKITRAMDWINAVTDGGVTAANLESDANWQVPAGKGQAFYDHLNGTKANLAAILAVTLADLDPGT